MKLVLVASLLLLPRAHAAELLKLNSPNPIEAESTMEALAPWETPIQGFFVRSHHAVPSVINPDSWTITIDGLVDKPLTLTVAELKKMRSQSLHAVLECSGNGRGQQVPQAPGVQWQRGAVGNAEWTGVPLTEILARAGVKPGVKFLRLEGADKPSLPTTPAFIRSIPLDKAQKPDTLIAWQMNREPLPLLHGAPIRLVLPGWYGENWVKWLNHITLTEAEDQGVYMKKGYRIPKTPVKPGEPWDPATGKPIEQLMVQSYIYTPIEGETVAAGPMTVRGKAFSGAGTIRRVEVSVDNGKSWKDAQVEAAHADGGWQEFELRDALEAPKDGNFFVMSRATDATGNTQPLEQAWNPGGYIRNAVDRIAVMAGPEALPSGRTVAEQKCMRCHAAQLLEGQRLSRDAWAAEIKKMQGFGADLNDREREALLKYVVRFSPDLPPPPPVHVSYDWQMDALRGLNIPRLGNARRGGQLFAKNCAVCHGAAGEGKIGPRIMGRSIAEQKFYLTVMDGKHLMPALGATLKQQDLADIRSYLTHGDHAGHAGRAMNRAVVREDSR